ncbi:MAG: hypothetical protein ACYDHT_00225 [Solirubrobacteraceae bacterium]
MSKLLEALLEVGVPILLGGLLLWACYFAFGPQVFGLPVIVGALVIAAGVRIFSNAGVSGLIFVLLGLLVLVLVIGMAMRLGSDRRRPPP